MSAVYLAISDDPSHHRESAAGKSSPFATAIKFGLHVNGLPLAVEEKTVS